MTEEHLLMIVDAVAKYEFRLPTREEDKLEYIKELIRHVDKRDWSAAHELRVGRRQVDWTPEDVKLFHEQFGHGHRGVRDTFKSNPTSFVYVEHKKSYETSDAGLMELANKELDIYASMRVDKPTKQLPAVCCVLDTTGSVRSTISDPEDRIAIVKTLDKIQPIFGFVVIIDAYRHAVDIVVGKATKVDSIVCHIGSRTLRRILSRDYKIENDVVIFTGETEENPSFDNPKMKMTQDPYAQIFAMPLTSDKVS